MINKNNILIAIGLLSIISLSGCARTTEGCIYDTIHTIERGIACDYKIYLTNDHGTGGDTASNGAGSYCVNGEELKNQIEEYAITGERVKICYNNYLMVIGSDYSAIILSVESAKK